MLEYCDPVGLGEWHEPEPSWVDIELREARSKARGKRAFMAALAASRSAMLAAVTTPPLAERFREQADKWERETGFLSSPTQRMMHPSYQAILGMAKDNEREIVALLIRDMREQRRPWFGALSYITKENPISQADFGKMDKMIASWVKWGENKHLS